MSNLPQLAQLEFPEEEIVENTDTVHTTFDWDFEKGDFKLINGKNKQLEGKEYLQVWIKKTLRTIKNSTIYKNTDYGSEHHSMIGTSFKPSFIHAELERMIREALLENNAISGVSNFSFNQDGSRMNVSFVVNSIYGTFSEDVRI